MLQQAQHCTIKLQTITTQTLTTGIHAFLTQKIKELDMQLRKPATAILALALSAGLAQVDDAAR